MGLPTIYTLSNGTATKISISIVQTCESNIIFTSRYIRYIIGTYIHIFICKKI